MAKTKNAIKTCENEIESKKRELEEVKQAKVSSKQQHQRRSAEKRFNCVRRARVSHFHFAVVCV